MRAVREGSPLGARALFLALSQLVDAMTHDSTHSADAAPAHPVVLRLLHWTNAFAVVVMILSGWRIYDASPLFTFVFPPGFTLGGWLAGALAWHFAAMWLLVANGLGYLAYGIVSGHLRRDLLFPPAGGGRYSAAQRAAYLGVIVVIVLAVLSGLAIWKPVQLQELTALMGGFEAARRVHFFAMIALALFAIGHAGLALRDKDRLATMTTGRRGAQR